MTASLWTGVEVADAVAPSAIVGSLPDALTGVSIDSRTVTPGDLFVALAGPVHDGHDHVAAALAKGAACALVHRPIAAEPLIRVADTLRALEALGAAARARSAARIVAVTGSVGKTSSKEMLALALGGEAATHASVGSFNNHWGVPLSLARLPRDAAYGVFEIGMNHAGEITPLTRLVRPQVAIVTTVEPAHLEFFPDVAAIADAKAEIFQGLEPRGVAVLNHDNEWFDRLADAAGDRRIISFGLHPEADARLVSIDGDADGSEVALDLLGRTIFYRIGQPGRHVAMNSAAVVAACWALGADPVRAAQSLAAFDGVAGRGKRRTIAVPGGTADLIDESYNASPAAVRAALAVLGAAPVGAGGRRIAVLGDMRELGAQGPALHRGLALAIEQAGIDLVFTCGPLMRELDAALPAARRAIWQDTAAALLPHVAANLRAGDSVMVKGSLGSRMADIVTPLLAGIAAPAISDPA